MIFVTLGSQKFQFNRLLQKLDELVAQGVIQDELFAQIGYSDYLPKNYPYKQFLNRDEFAEAQEKSDIVITHGGTGAIIGAVKKGKKVIAVPRLAKYGEHVDDHQIQLLEQFDGMGIIEACYNLNELGDCYVAATRRAYAEYVSNTTQYLTAIENYLKSAAIK